MRRNVSLSPKSLPDAALRSWMRNVAFDGIKLRCGGKVGTGHYAEPFGCFVERDTNVIDFHVRAEV